MVERVTQRANFGNLRPQARPVDTFRRQDTRDLDNFIEFANQRLKATQGIIDAGFGAYQTFRESKQEEIAFKAQADAVKGTVDPKLQGSWAIYGKQQKRTKSLLKAREEGNKIINDTDFLAGVFNETEQVNKDPEQAQFDSKSLLSGLRPDEETGEYGAEQIYKVRIDEKINSIIQNNPDIDVEELLRYKGQLDQTFFETVRKNEVNNRVATFREVVRTTMFDKTSPAFQSLFRLYSDDDKATPVGFNKNFYSILGTLTDQGMAEGLTREQSVNVALKEIIGVAYTFDNANSNSGRIIDEEEKLYITNIIGALQDKVTDPRVLKSGSMLMDNNQYREFIFENIEKLDLMLENGEKENEAEAKRTAKKEMNTWMREITFDIKFPENNKKTGITTVEKLRERLEAGEKESWYQYYDLNSNLLTNLFNTRKQRGGQGDLDQFRQAMHDATFGLNNLTPGQYFKNPNLIISKFSNLNSEQERLVIDKMLSSSSDRSSEKVYAQRWSDHLASRLVGNVTTFKALVSSNDSLAKAYHDNFDKFRIRAEIIERDFQNVGADVKSAEYKKLFEELDNDLDAMLKSYYETDRTQTVLDPDDLDTLPDWLIEKDKETGLPETLYMAFLLERKPEIFETVFPDSDTSPFTRLFDKSKGRATKDGITPSQAIIQDFEKAQMKVFGFIPNAKDNPDKSYEEWERRLYAEKGVGFKNKVMNTILSAFDDNVEVDLGGRLIIRNLLMGTF